jgi:CheY-like chemotaxis protein
VRRGHELWRLFWQLYRTMLTLSDSHRRTTARQITLFTMSRSIYMTNVQCLGQPESRARIPHLGRGTNVQHAYAWNACRRVLHLIGGRSVIAVVDDEESVRKAVVRVLRAAGFAAQGFSSGDEFLRSWHFDRPDCLVLDLQMPDISGMEVQKALNLAGAHFPIVIITAHDAPAVREECLRLGAIAYLCKPLDVRSLLDTVALVLNSPD